jgi:hypothetical protein
MSKLILMTALLLASFSAMAEWVSVGQSDDGVDLLYIDPNTFRIVDNFTKVWELLDYSTLQKTTKFSFRSIKMQIKFDCVNKKGKTLILLFYSDNMGGGRIVKSVLGSNKFLPVMKESTTELAYKYICDR